MIKAKHASSWWMVVATVMALVRLWWHLWSSTWRIPQPKHIEWLNSCGILKVTHKIRVPFTVGEYVDKVECDALSLEMLSPIEGKKKRGISRDRKFGREER
jgi:hypothetical protein